MFEQTEHTGRLYRLKKSGGGRWKECWMVLLCNGELLWYNDKHCSQLGGSADLKDSLHQITIGQSVVQKYGSKVPVPPEDFGGENFIAVPTKKEGSIQWLYTKTESDLSGWVKAFSSVIGKSTAYEIVYEKYRKPRNLKSLNRNPSGDDDDRFRRLGLAIRATDTKDSEEELSRPEIDWGAAWKEIVSSKVNDEKPKAKPISVKVLQNGAPTISDMRKNGPLSPTVPQTLDLPPSKPEGNNSLVDEVMTVVADVHSISSEEDVYDEKF